jgi:hypothetical protein
MIKQKTNELEIHAEYKYYMNATTALNYTIDTRKNK